MSNPVVAAWNDAGIKAASAGRMAAAAAALRRAVGLDPDSPDLHSNLGNVLRRMGRPEEGYRHLVQALKLEPRHEAARANLACWYMDDGNPSEAIRLFEEALAAEDVESWRFGYSGALLQAGRWAEGFREYEVRLKQRDFGSKAIPLWDGSPLEGRTLLLHAEQGLGDTIMFSRFVDLLEAAEFVVPQQLHWLMAHNEGRVNLHVGRAGEKIEGVDCHLPLMSLPHVLGVKEIRGERYLSPVHRMALEKPPGTKHKIGLVWKAKANWKQQTADEMLHGLQKSMPLDVLLELTAIPGAALYGLQVGSTDIADAGASDIVTDLAHHIHDFADLASFIDQMDVVVSVDTAPAHLAGALGKPTVVCCHWAGSWQWMTGERTAWYDSVRIVRQEKPGEWTAEKIVETVRDCLG